MEQLVRRFSVLTVKAAELVIGITTGPARVERGGRNGTAGEVVLCTYC